MAFLDILLHEAYSNEWAEKAKTFSNNFKDKIKTALESHTSTLEAAELAKKANVKHLVFTHLLPSPTPQFFFEHSWIKGVKKIYSGKVTVGRDLMMF